MAAEWGDVDEEFDEFLEFVLLMAGANPLTLLERYEALRPPWMARAACRGSTVSFFPRFADKAGALRAKAICGDCPVREECLDYGDMEQTGIWGGLSTVERRRRRTTAA